MLFYRTSIRIVCTLAIFLMAGGQVLHACVDWKCGKEQATEESCPDRQDCPIGHDCSCACSCINLTMTEHAEFLFMTAPSSSYPVRNETCGEGPCREIDHPPQLS